MKYIGNIIIVLFLLAYSTVYYIEVIIQAKKFEDHAVISIAYIALVIFSLTMIILDLKKWLKSREQFVISWSQAKKPIFFFAMLTGYLVSIYFLGFFTSSFMFFIVAAYWLGSRNWKELILIPLVILTVVYALFVVFLNQRIVSGFLF
jgi:hypothetical protein